MSFAQQVAAVFQGAHIDSIDFRLAGFQISGPRLRKVGEAIACGRISVKQEDGGGTLSAAYSPYSDTFTLPKNANASADKWKVAILHEGIHALVDIFGENAALTVLDDEIAAYVAEVIYYRKLRRPLPSGASERAIYTTANEIVTKHRLDTKRGVHLKAADVKKLREAIHAHPAYSGIGETTKTGGHGLKRPCTAKGHRHKA
jgi:hypothetical protein